MKLCSGIEYLICVVGLKGRNNFVQHTLYEVIRSRLGEFASHPLFSPLIESIDALDSSDRNLIKFNYTDPNTKKNYLAKISYADEAYNKTRLYITNYTDLTELV